MKRFSFSGVFKKPEDTHNWGPLLITVGPNCCGKSTFVRSLNENVTEICTDNAPELYEKVPISPVVCVWQDKISGEVVQILKNHTILQVPMLERLKKLRGTEQSLIGLLFAKFITFEDFEAKVSTLLGDADHIDIFVGCVRELYHTKGCVLRSKTIDVFIGESVEGASTQAAADMKAAIKTNQGVICWGNTNLNPDFYKDVLKICDKYQRVVRFVRWGKEIPIIPLKELFKRNVLKFLETGRYVDSSKIAKFRQYAGNFVVKAGSNNHNDYAALAGFEMDERGCVAEKDSPHKKSKEPVTSKYVSWANHGFVYNLSGVPPAARSPRGDKLSRDGSLHSTEGDLDPNRVSGRAKSAASSVNGSVTGSAGINFSAAATKTVQPEPDPNVLPLSESALKAVGAKPVNDDEESIGFDSHKKELASKESSQKASEIVHPSTGPTSSTGDSTPHVAVASPAKNGAPHEAARAEHAPKEFNLLTMLGIRLEAGGSDTPDNSDPNAAKFVIDDSTPRTEPHPHNRDHSVLLQDSVKLTHIHRESSQNMTKSVGLPADFKRSNSGSAPTSAPTSERKPSAVSFVEPPAPASPAVFILDTDSPVPLNRQPSANHEVHIKDSVKLAHLHEEERLQHPPSADDDRPLGHPKDHAKHPIFIEPKDEEAGVSTKSANFVLDDHSPRLTHERTENDEILLQDSVKLTHIHRMASHDKPLFNPVIVKHDSFDLKDPTANSSKSQQSPPVRKLSFKPELVQEIPTPTSDSPVPAKSSPRSAASSLFPGIEPTHPSAAAHFVLDENSPVTAAAQPRHHPHHEVHLQDSVKLTHYHEDHKHDKPAAHPPIHVVKIELTPEQNSHQLEKHISFHSDALHVESSEEEDGEPEVVLTPKKVADPNSFACVIPGLLCSLGF